jgi:hypothetical protein
MLIATKQTRFQIFNTASTADLQAPFKSIHTNILLHVISSHTVAEPACNVRVQMNPVNLY